jgi:hypothetical protein
VFIMMLANVGLYFALFGIANGHLDVLYITKPFRERCDDETECAKKRDDQRLSAVLLAMVIIFTPMAINLVFSLFSLLQRCCKLVMDQQGTDREEVEEYASTNSLSTSLLDGEDEPGLLMLNNSTTRAEGGGGGEVAAETKGEATNAGANEVKYDDLEHAHGDGGLGTTVLDQWWNEHMFDADNVPRGAYDAEASFKDHCANRMPREVRFVWL